MTLTAHAPETERALAENARYAATFDRPNLDLPPARKLAVLACMDARLTVEDVLGLRSGEAHIIRNAGGLATDDAIRSLSISQRLLGTEEIVVVMHEGCGLHGASEDDYRQMLAADGVLPSWRLGAFDDVEDTLCHSLERLRNSKELQARDHIRGFVFDPEDGSLREVDPAR
jgi:carbonic anhydrase